MSEELLKEAAAIRTAQAAGANTAGRVGGLLEKMISAHDRLKDRLPDPVVSPRVIDITTLDQMNTADYALAGPQMPGAYYLVTRSTGPTGQRQTVVGTLTVFSDSAMHAVTQILHTHELPAEDGMSFAGVHNHNKVQVWTRSYGLRMGSTGTAPGTDGYFPLGGWGKWHRLTVPADSSGGGGGGESAPADLEALRQEVGRLRKDLEEIRGLLLIS